MHRNSVPYKMPLALKIAFYVVLIGYMLLGAMADLQMQNHTGPFADVGDIR